MSEEVQLRDLFTAMYTCLIPRPPLSAWLVAGTLSLLFLSVSVSGIPPHTLAFSLANAEDAAKRVESPQQVVNENQVTWARIGDDLELSRIDLWPDSLFSPELVVIRTSLKRYHAKVVDTRSLGAATMTAARAARESGAVLAINAHFFDERNRPLGLLVKNGHTIQGLHQSGATLTGVFQISRNEGPSVVHRSDVLQGRLIEALQAGPRLLVKGKPVKTKQQNSSRRSGLCVDNQRRLIVYITSGLFGSTFEEVQRALLSPGVDCVDALNLDGGGSSQLFIGDSLPEQASQWRPLNVAGSDPVPTVLALFRTDN